MIVSGPVGNHDMSHLESVKEVPAPKPKSKLQIPGLFPVDYESGSFITNIT